ncbi:protein kinase domain-containing protein [Ditylenchus destructor]|nr:protein kinase domain-containing protein [Ditylenchus destructor]
MPEIGLSDSLADPQCKTGTISSNKEMPNTLYLQPGTVIHLETSSQCSSTPSSTEDDSIDQDSAKSAPKLKVKILPPSSIDPNLDPEHQAGPPNKNLPHTPTITTHHSHLLPKASLPSASSSPNIGTVISSAGPTSSTTETPSQEIPTSPIDDPTANLTFQKILKGKGLRSTITNRTPRDFFFIKVLGEGSFSTVYFAKEVDTGDDYAIKVMMKSEIRREKKVRYVLREKDVMAALTYGYGGHPFVVKLYCTFQDRDRLYFAMTYAKHGELLDWLRRLGSFDEAVTLFYASEILYALEFLHVKCNIIHRDLKPENILLNADWHIMLSDFGTAKIMCETDGEAGDEEDHNDDAKNDSIKAEPAEKKTARSSFVGTAQYISPEVLKSENVGPECDYWALGAIIFQMISGQPPFRALNEYQILRKILGMEFNFPEGFPAIARDLVQRSLVYDPTRRLGSKETGGIEALKGHKFFVGVDWADLPNKKPPELKPYLPASCGEPAFYSDYQLPENMEPGLNEAALNRLMGLGLGTSGSNFSEFEYAKSESPILAAESADQLSMADSSATQSTEFTTPQPEILIEQKKREKLEAQRRLHKYHRFVDDLLITKSGLIDKKKGLFARRRMFLLCDGHFLSIRTYYLFDPERHAKDWCDAIDDVRESYFNKPNVTTQASNPHSDPDSILAKAKNKEKSKTTVPPGSIAKPAQSNKIFGGRHSASKPK